MEPPVVEGHHQGRRVDVVHAEADEVRRAMGGVAVHGRTGNGLGDVFAELGRQGPLSGRRIAHRVE